MQMARVFKALSQERRFKKDGWEFVSAADYAPNKSDADYVRKSDVPWLNRFAADKGNVVISGNTRMLDIPHEMEALRRHGFVVVFFERKWNQWTFYSKSALLLYHWEIVAKQLRKAKPGEFWCVPNHFRSDGLRDVTPGVQRIEKSNTRRPNGVVSTRNTKKLNGAAPHVSARSSRKGELSNPEDQRQAALSLQGGGPRNTPRDEPKAT